MPTNYPWGNYVPSDEDLCLATAQDSTLEPELEPVRLESLTDFIPSDDDACLATAEDM